MIDGKAVVEYAKKVYLKDNVDFLIISGEQDTAGEIVHEVVEVMENQDSGLVLNVIVDYEEEDKVVC